MRVCVFFEDKVFNRERLILCKNTKRINDFTYFYFKKALFTLCIKSFVGESFKLNYVSTKVKNTFYYNKLLILDMNSYV